MLWPGSSLCLPHHSAHCHVDTGALIVCRRRLQRPEGLDSVHTRKLPWQGAVGYGMRRVTVLVCQFTYPLQSGNSLLTAGRYARDACYTAACRSPFVPWHLGSAPRIEEEDQ